MIHLDDRVQKFINLAANIIMEANDSGMRGVSESGEPVYISYCDKDEAVNITNDITTISDIYKYAPNEFNPFTCSFLMKFEFPIEKIEGYQQKTKRYTFFLGPNQNAVEPDSIFILQLTTKDTIRTIH